MLPLWIKNLMTYMKESSSHKAALWIIARLAAVIMIFIFLIYFEMLDFQKVQQMLFKWWTAAAAICFLTGVIVLTFRWQILLIAVGIRPGIKIVIRLSFIGYAFSTIIPGAVSGDIIKAYYIVKRRSNKRTVAATTILLDRALGLFTMLLTAAVSIEVLLLMPQLSQYPEQKSGLLYLGYIVISLAIIMLIGFLVCLNKRLRNTQIARWVMTRPPAHRIIDKLYSTLYSFREKKRTLFKAIVISFAGQLPFIVGMYCIGQTVDESILGFAHYIFLAPLALILNAIPIGPGGMGSGEALVESLFMLFGSRNGSEIMVVFHIALVLISLIGFMIYIKGKREFGLALKKDMILEKT